MIDQRVKTKDELATDIINLEEKMRKQPSKFLQIKIKFKERRKKKLEFEVEYSDIGMNIRLLLMTRY